ncbi:Methyltransf-11 domain-containing protein [Aphelenchoides bicaudatus]|nr:Methyltransf-11 domain-containing protein [Aphelenchoides bicaudatus]
MPPVRQRRTSTSRPLLAETYNNVTESRQLNVSQSMRLYWKALISSFIVYDWLGYLISLIVVFILDAGVNWYMLNRVKYTNIDWTAYMEQVEVYKNGERDYFKIRGDTGPLVYPAGHLYVYTILNYFTSNGANVQLAQRIFVGIYFLNQLAVYSLFIKSKQIGAGVLIVMLSLSHRIHSIFVLRLFNDPIAMLLFFISANFMVRKCFPIACIFYSLAVSIKMNILLFAPALFFIMLLSEGPRKTVMNLSICAVVQLVVGFEFLSNYPLAYLGRAFELGRVFQYRWSVNWQHLPENIFLATNFHLILLLAHVFLLLIFMFSTWFQRHGGLFKLITDLIRNGKLVNLDTHDILYSLFTANLAGIVFARSIHFQFYTWYYHSLFYLLYSTISTSELKPPEFKNFTWTFFKWIAVAFVLAGIEVVYNIYPPRAWASLLLNVEHVGIVIWLIYQARLQKRVVNKLIMSQSRILRQLTLVNRTSICKASSSTIPGNVQVFDRELKRRQRNWAVNSVDFDKAQYLREECGYRIADRVFDLTKFNDVCVDLGCGTGYIAPHLIKENVGVLIQCDMSEGMIRKAKETANSEFTVESIVADEELVPFRNESVDLVLSSLSAHWINDLPGWFRRCLQILKPDGAMIGSLLASDTMHELRVSLQLAEMERLGGLGSHISPFVQPQDIGSLMNQAGFGMITLDLDEITIGYPDIFSILYDLQIMGESNATKRRSALRRDTLIAAQAIYQSMYGKGDDHLPCTFQVLSFIGWRPGPQMPKPAKRGSQTHSLKDLGSFVESPEKFALLDKK